MFSKRIIVFLTIISFLANIVLVDAWGLALSASSKFVSDYIDINNFSLPKDLGKVTDSYTGSGERTIFHIQDAHCNYAAQKKIIDIIKYLNSEYNITNVNLEGGVGRYDLSPFTNIKDRKIREEASDFFLKEGLINGAEFFAVNTDRRISLWGVENEALYFENLNAYRNSLVYKKEKDRYIGKLQKSLSELKKYLYSEDLKELDEKYYSYRKEKVPFEEYVSFLAYNIQRTGVSYKNQQNFSLLIELLEKEKNINFEEANKQRDRLIDILSSILSDREMEILVAKTVSFKLSKAKEGEFYSYLRSKAEALGLYSGAFGEFEKYLQYLFKYKMIDNTRLMSEVLEIEDQLKEAYFENDTQERLDHLSKYLDLMDKMFEINFTAEEYASYLKSKDLLSVSNCLDFVLAESQELGIKIGIDKSVLKLEEYCRDMEKFYECSFKRDGAFVNNLFFGKANLGFFVSRFLKDETAIPQRAVLITGGFHLENLKKILKEKNISFISITPAMEKLQTSRSPYKKLLKGVKNIFISESSATGQNIAILSQLSSVEGDMTHDDFSKLVKTAASLLAKDEDPRKSLKGIFPGKNHSSPAGGNDKGFTAIGALVFLSAMSCVFISPILGIALLSIITMEIARRHNPSISWSKLVGLFAILVIAACSSGGSSGDNSSTETDNPSQVEQPTQVNAGTYFYQNGNILRIIEQNGNITEYYQDGSRALDYDSSSGIYTTYSWTSTHVTIVQYSGRYVINTATSQVHSGVVQTEIVSTYSYEHNGEKGDLDLSTNGWKIVEKTIESDYNPLYSEMYGHKVTYSYDGLDENMPYRVQDHNLGWYYLVTYDLEQVPSVVEVTRSRYSSATDTLTDEWTFYPSGRPESVYSYSGTEGSDVRKWYKDEDSIEGAPFEVIGGSFYFMYGHLLVGSQSYSIESSDVQNSLRDYLDNLKTKDIRLFLYGDYREQLYVNGGQVTTSARPEALKILLDIFKEKSIKAHVVWIDFMFSDGISQENGYPVGEFSQIVSDPDLAEAFWETQRPLLKLLKDYPNIISIEPVNEIELMKLGGSFIDFDTAYSFLEKAIKVIREETGKPVNISVRTEDFSNFAFFRLLRPGDYAQIHYYSGWMFPEMEDLGPYLADGVNIMVGEILNADLEDHSQLAYERGYDVVFSWIEYPETVYYETLLVNPQTGIGGGRIYKIDSHTDNISTRIEYMDPDNIFDTRYRSMTSFELDTGTLLEKNWYYDDVVNTVYQTTYSTGDIDIYFNYDSPDYGYIYMSLNTALRAPVITLDSYYDTGEAKYKNIYRQTAESGQWQYDYSIQYASSGAITGTSVRTDMPDLNVAIDEEGLVTVVQDAEDDETNSADEGVITFTYPSRVDGNEIIFDVGGRDLTGYTMEVTFEGLSDYQMVQLLFKTGPSQGWTNSYSTDFRVADISTITYNPAEDSCSVCDISDFSSIAEVGVKVFHGDAQGVAGSIKEVRLVPQGVSSGTYSSIGKLGDQLLAGNNNRPFSYGVFLGTISLFGASRRRRPSTGNGMENEGPEPNPGKEAEVLYEAAKKIIPDILEVSRKAPTHVLEPVTSIDVVSPVVSCINSLEKGTGKKGHHIYADTYLASSDWKEALIKKIQHGNFVEDFCVSLRGEEVGHLSRMTIRILSKTSSEYERDVADIKEVIRQKLVELGVDADQVIDNKINFAACNVSGSNYLNTTIDLFVDIIMTELDRYGKEDGYSDEVPDELVENFRRLLKMSITNYNDLEALAKSQTKGQEKEVLLAMVEKVFAGYILRIIPINWGSIRKWKHNQDLVLRAL